jgi:hypothetical protein
VITALHQPSPAHLKDALVTVAGLSTVAADQLVLAIDAIAADDGDDIRHRVGTAAWRLADAAAMLALVTDALALTGPGLSEPTGRGALLRPRAEAGA